MKGAASQYNGPPIRELQIISDFQVGARVTELLGLLSSECELGVRPTPPAG